MKRKLYAFLIILVCLALLATTSIAFADSGSAVNAGGTPRATQSVVVKQNKTARALAQRFGVTYEEIMGWYQRGYSFSEIKFAYYIRSGSGNQASIQDLFNLRAQGLGWGQIAQQYNVRLGNK